MKEEGKETGERRGEEVGANREGGGGKRGREGERQRMERDRRD